MAIMPHSPINYMHFLVLKGLLTLVSCDFLVCGRTHALVHLLSLNLHHGLDWQNVDNMKFTIACVPRCACGHVFKHVCLCMRRCVSVHGCACVTAGSVQDFAHGCYSHYSFLALILRRRSQFGKLAFSCNRPSSVLSYRPRAQCPA